MIPTSSIKSNGKVDMWDVGPAEPVLPTEPKTPAENLTGAKKLKAEVEFEDAMASYKDKLKHYEVLKSAYRRWHATNEGPVKVELWAVDARHAMDVEPDRFKIDLPKGMKPGRRQIEAEERERGMADSLRQERNSDPQFGGILT